MTPRILGLLLNGIGVLFSVMVGGVELSCVSVVIRVIGDLFGEADILLFLSQVSRFVMYCCMRFAAISSFWWVVAMVISSA